MSSLGQFHLAMNPRQVKQSSQGKISLLGEESTVNKRITVGGTYSRNATRHVSSHWDQVCADHEEEFPAIRECYPGTFNVVLHAGERYTPPGESAYRDRAKARGRPVGRYEHGNHMSPRARVVEMNGKPVEAWIYRGGHPAGAVIELISFVPLASTVGLQDQDIVTLLIDEVAEGTSGMPACPPQTPGATVG